MATQLTREPGPPKNDYSPSGPVGPEYMYVPSLAACNAPFKTTPPRQLAWEGAGCCRRTRHAQVLLFLLRLFGFFFWFFFLVFWFFWEVAQALAGQEPRGSSSLYSRRRNPAHYSLPRGKKLRLSRAGLVQIGLSRVGSRRHRGANDAQSSQACDCPPRMR